MKLGTQTGNPINHLMSESKQPTPKVGMGATILSWTDRHAGTVVDVTAFGDRILIQADRATRADSNGMSESQTYTYERNPKGAVYTFKRDATGRWVEYRVNERTGRYNKIKGGHGLLLGHRDAYHDYSF